MIGVILYHCGVHWIPGGLLGVDVFFVLSGFLITSLLLREVRGGGGVSLRAFWGRRARRLLPALLLVLLAVRSGPRSTARPTSTASGSTSSPPSATSRTGASRTPIRAISPSAQAPSPVLHLWSLGVEEQFYLFWPVLVAGVVGLARLGTRASRWSAKDDPVRPSSGRVAVFLLAAAGTAASTTWLIILERRGVDASRLYYGTDTRALALLTGATLAALLPLPRSPDATHPTVSAGPALDLVGALSLAGLLAIFLNVSGQSPLLYRGGFLSWPWWSRYCWRR